MGSEDKSSQLFVLNGIDGVPYNTEAVKTGQDRLG